MSWPSKARNSPNSNGLTLMRLPSARLPVRLQERSESMIDFVPSNKANEFQDHSWCNILHPASLFTMRTKATCCCNSIDGIGTPLLSSRVATEASRLAALLRPYKQAKRSTLDININSLRLPSGAKISRVAMWLSRAIYLEIHAKVPRR